MLAVVGEGNAHDAFNGTLKRGQLVAIARVPQFDCAIVTAGEHHGARAVVSKRVDFVALVCYHCLARSARQLAAEWQGLHARIYSPRHHLALRSCSVVQQHHTPPTEGQEHEKAEERHTRTQRHLHQASSRKHTAASGSN